MNTMNTSRQLTIVACLPQVLLDYLWEMIRTVPCKKQPQAQLTLRPVRLGGNEVQEIRMRCGGQEEVRRVFGFSPVTADLRVEWRREGGVMQLVRWNKDCV